MPVFAGLLAFDAVARLGTVQRAADELGLSQPATSRRLLALEADLGVPLFDRRSRPWALTREGRELEDAVRAGLTRIQEVVTRLRQPSRSALTISAGAGFSAYWLIPRLPRMQRAFPDQSLRIVSQSHDREIDSTGDLQIRFGTPTPDDSEVTLLFREHVFPVASPLLLGKRAAPRSPDDLAPYTLLDMHVPRRPWYDWAEWLRAVGGSPPASGRRVQFDSYPMVVAAALAGQGVGLCWDGLLDDFLHSGALVCVGPTVTNADRGYYIAHARGLPVDHRVRRVADWILAESRLDPTRARAPA